MSTVHLDPPIKRRVAEPVLAVLAVALMVTVVTEPVTLFETTFDSLWLPITILVSGLLALSVLIGVLTHGIRLGSAVLGSGTRSQPGDTAVSRILASVVLGVFALFSLWWAVATLFVHYLVDTGGVSPSIWALLFGGVLGTLVLLRTAFFQLFPEGPLARLRCRSLK
ncbi:hypothetical protein C488_19827 [Natrinema pellirubrum DSM 15624]|uniref:Uncharacterized protein n=1 Tax=Natrinema pellirubrum (strain DSM 15624 / CIP 106293 / JCM 10476 / NCIMB 786 / 157) TaxID=797303 RepID=L0JIH7_NATP1|nr:hypothetical protein [Natrinema pellirubrum]AGB30146.1 hypothetical protein Natpe_0206 [Natrinema pellirubrum DSM 15624]ELY69852.1 hypothetical protein C488_19827 [Natrinema pellirubrum DSM 15624]